MKSARGKPDAKEKPYVTFRTTRPKLARYRRAAQTLFPGETQVVSMFLRRAADKLADEVLSGGARDAR